MIIPAAGRTAGRPTAQSASIPAPVGGWNARDALDGMKPIDAIQLDNFFPSTDSVELRRGHVGHATGIGSGAVETLISYASGPERKLLAIGGGAIYDCSTPGAVGTALKSGSSNSRFQYVNFMNHALLFNGADTPQKYDGTTVTDNTITGTELAPSDLIYPFVSKRRVFLVERNTLNAWYLGTNSISGPASKLDLSAYCPLGGHLVAGGTWTRDGGAGSDDLTVFVTSRGEVLVFEGIDPADADTWSLVGLFRTGAPVGQRPILNAGSDLILITLDGFTPLSKILPIDRIGAGKAAISDKIMNAVNAATASYGGNFGWEAIFYPKGNWGLFNVPVAENQMAHQYVYNAITGAWCRFIGMNASCWALFDDDLYFGGRIGTVYRADAGANDAGSLIQGDIRPAFSYFGSRGRQKRFSMMRPVTSADAPVAYGYALDTDYGERLPNTVATIATEGSFWDESFWDGAEWANEATIYKKWLSVRGIGFCASAHLRVSTDAVSMAIYSIDYVFDVGGVL